ncbi:MAG: serine hydrolase domain-containing protein [Methylocella sp.]
MSKIPGQQSANAFDAVITQLMNDYAVPGASVAVSQNGAIVLARGYGLLDANDPNSGVAPTNIFRIASVTKPITAAAVMLLVQNGLLNLDASVWSLLAAKFPLLPGKTLTNGVDLITIRQLLQHSSGWDGSQYDPMFDVVAIAEAEGIPAPAGKAAIIRYMWSQELYHQPGQCYAYANFNYLLLGRVIELITGQDYADYVTQNILAPFGATETMQGSSFESGRYPNESLYYPYAGEGLEPSVFPPVGSGVLSPYGSFDLENMDSHGAWVSSPSDLLGFINGVFSGGLLNQDTLAAIVANRATACDGSGALYGLGWALTPAGNGFNIWHSGSLPGTTSILVKTIWSDGSNVCWAAVLNTRNEDWSTISGALDQAMWNAVDTLDFGQGS